VSGASKYEPDTLSRRVGQASRPEASSGGERAGVAAKAKKVEEIDATGKNVCAQFRENPPPAKGLRRKIETKQPGTEESDLGKTTHLAMQDGPID